MEKQRSSFTGKIGFVLAAAGSAVGLGNIWRFPYLAAKYGGGIFLLTYILLALTFGFALMCAEIAIGRKTGKSAIEAFGDLNKKYSFIGILASLVPIIILPYYSVIGGWVTKYITVFVSGQGAAAADGNYFGNFIGGVAEPLVYFLIFMGITALIVLFGVEKGIEKVSKFLMPLLVFMIIGITVYVLCQPGIGAGVKDYLLPNFKEFSINTVLGAMGQLFYSMSLAMGIMITYGSYMKKDNHIERSVHQIEWFDTGIAVMAGMMIVPAATVFGGGEVNKGPGLMFATLPAIFDKMPGGHIVGAVFFILVLFAALTSSISLMETIVSIFCDKFGWNRKVTCLVVFLGCLVMGIPSSLGFGVWSHILPLGMDLLTFFDFISNSVMMPIVALLTCIFVGYVIKPASLIEEVEQTGAFKAKKLFTVIIKYVAPICIVLILISSVLDGLGIFKI